MVDITKSMNNARQLKALIGLSKHEYESLLPSFKQSYDEFKEAEFLRKRKKRKRAKGGGSKGKLNTMGIKLFFILFYLKTYPTFDVLGSYFNLSRSKACDNAHSLSKVLLLTFSKHNALPAREINSVSDMQKIFGTNNTLIVDATERANFRHKNQALQKEHYSGKKSDIPKRTPSLQTRRSE